MKEFKDFESLFREIEKEAERSLITDVSKKVIQVAQKHVDSDVYGVYSPKEYSRTGKLRNSFVANPVQDGIEIVNNREDYDRDTGEIREIDEIIEYGHDASRQGYTYAVYYPNGDNYIQPRPFMENTEKEIIATNLHTKALKQSLESKGFKVE